MSYKILNWEKYQVRLDRPGSGWVKLHKSLLDSADFYSVPVNRRWEWPLLLLMCDNHDGVIEKTDEQIGFMLYKELGKLFDPKPFIGRFLEADYIPDLREERDLVADGDGLTPLDTNCHQASKTPIKDAGFDAFWQAYHPNGKQSRIKARTEWVKAGCYKIIPEVMAGLERAKASEQWLKEGGKYVKHAHYWLKDGCWTNELQPARRNGAPRPGVFT